MHNKFFIFLRQQFAHFSCDDFIPRGWWKEPAINFLAWSIPACLFVLYASRHAAHIELYQNAIDEGIGPNLWNVIGSLGFFLFGFSLVLSHWDGLRKVSRIILENTFSMGSLTFGLLLGQFLSNLTALDMIWWQQGLFGVTSAFLFLVLAFYNLSIWYLSYLLSDNYGCKSLFLMKLEQMHLLWRVIFGLSAMLLIAVIFFFGNR